LNELIDVPVPPAELAERLTMTGFEIEGIEAVNGDTVLEVNVTPNRPDCLSVLGIAREVSAAFNVPLKLPQCDITGEQPSSGFTIHIFTPELCSRYCGRYIKGVRTSASPEWIKQRLEQCGIRSINNIVDITNYVLLEFGHPLHAFDAGTLRREKVIIGPPDVITEGKSSVRIKTLDGIERAVPDESLLIWDSERPVAVAGVMGGASTEVTGATKDIFLESAYFNPVSIRRTSRRMNLVSESSYRFERGTDIEFLEKALDRAALLIQQIAGGTVHRLIDAYPLKYMPQSVTVNYGKMNRILGVSLAVSEILEILNRLGIRTEDKGETAVVYPPPFRRDIRSDIDVAEEIARLHGFDRVPVSIPRGPLLAGSINSKVLNRKLVHEAMRKTGFNEAINFSFMNMSSLDMLSIPDNDRRRKAVIIRNPLRQEDSCLRTTLIPALIEDFRYNLDRGMKEIRIFEIARVFGNCGKQLPDERLMLGGIWYHEKSPSLWKEDAPGFFVAKGALDSLFDTLNIRNCSFLPASEPFLHAGNAADISVSGSRIGYIGVLGPDIIGKLGLKKQKPEIVVFEIDLEAVFRHIPDSVKYVQIPKFPYVERDIALVTDETIPSADILAIIRTYPSGIIEDINVFDSYKGPGIPAGKKSLAFSITYRSADRTLTDDEVSSVHDSLVSYVMEKTGGELRK
jgi:phenylalanyl-tRNA synthetase beta chain